jgi:hypothetical protein
MIKRFIILFSLLSIWVIMTIFQIVKSDISPTVFSRISRVDIFKNNKSRDLLKNEIRSGEFVATNNNLGIIVIRFNTHGKSVKDQFVFKIKEKSAKNWYYSSTINIDQITDESLFPLGLPIINESVNKSYLVELMSLNGDKNNHISFSNNFPMFISRYQYDKSRIKSDYKYLIEFIIGKSLSVVDNNEQIYQSLLFLVPFILYVLWDFIIKKYIHIRLFHISNIDLKPLENIIVLLYLLFLAFDIFVFKSTICPIDITLMAIWLIYSKNYKITYRLTFLIASLLYVFTYINNNGLYNWSIEKNIFLANFFILFGGIQLLISKLTK